MIRTAALLVVLMAAQPGGAVWIDVPFVAQPSDGCGAASVAMVMQYWAAQEHRTAGPASRVEAIQKQVYSPKLHGATPVALERYLQRNGYLTFAMSGTWKDLETQVRKGRPLIVALRPDGQRALHYVVVDGIDPAREIVTMNDPALRKLLTEERAGFEKDWSATHYWMLLAVPKQAQH
jgi:predicted double-glycine peptidase